MPEVAFPKWQKGKMERRDFSPVCLLKGLGTLNEISRQQVWRKQGGSLFSPARVGVARLCSTGWSVCRELKWAHKRATESHGWKAFRELLLTKKQLFLMAQESS